MEIRCLSDIRAELGESPVWSEAEGVVYWIDILSKHLHRTDPETGGTTTWDLPSTPGMIGLRVSGGLVIALKDGLYSFDPASAQFDRLAPLEAAMTDNRPNDGKVDAAGRLWVGTMDVHDGREASGSLYRIDTNLGVVRVLPDYRIPNGLAWSPDDRIMYHTDTRSGVVDKFQFDPETGAISDKQPFFSFDRQTDGGVDGAAMDRAGGYWTAFYGGGKIARLFPSGELDLEIPVPVSQPTMPAFGGPDHRTIFITSARQRLSEGALAAEPLAGALLAVTVEHQGHPVAAFGG